MVEDEALDALFVLAGEDQQRLRRAALLIDLAKAKGGEWPTSCPCSKMQRNGTRSDSPRVPAPHPLRHVPARWRPRRRVDPSRFRWWRCLSMITCRPRARTALAAAAKQGGASLHGRHRCRQPREHRNVQDRPLASLVSVDRPHSEVSSVSSERLVSRVARHEREAVRAHGLLSCHDWLMCTT